MTSVKSMDNYDLMLHAFKDFGMIFGTHGEDDFGYGPAISLPEKTEYIKSLQTFRNDNGNVEDWLILLTGGAKTGDQFKRYEKIRDLLPSAWVELARLVANQQIFDVRVFRNQCAVEISYRFSNITFARVSAFKSFTFNEYNDLYMSILQDIKTLQDLREKFGRFKFFRQCQYLALLSDIKLTFGKLLVGTIVSTKITVLNFTPTGEKPCDVKEQHTYDNDSLEAYHIKRLRKFVKDNIISTGRKTIKKMAKLGFNMISKSGDGFVIHRDDWSQNTEVTVDKSYPYDRYSFLNEYLDRLPAEKATPPAPVTSQAKDSSNFQYRLKPEPEEHDDTQMLIGETTSTIVGIFVVKNFDPATMVVKSDDFGVKTIYARRGMGGVRGVRSDGSNDGAEYSATKVPPILILEPIFKFDITQAEPTHWLTASFQLGRVFDSKKKYMIITNPDHQDFHKAAMALTKTLN